jgi:hypothetical protein
MWLSWKRYMEPHFLKTHSNHQIKPNCVGNVDFLPGIYMSKLKGA